MIFNFQQGGAIPFVTYKPVIVTGGEQQAQSSGTKSSSSGGIGSKEIFELLSKEKLLPNDFRKIATQLQDFQTTPSNTAGMESNYLQILNGLQNAMYNKEEYSKAFNTVKENKGLNEVAITLSGELMCVNKEGDYKLLSPGELSNNKEYIPLTNSQLLSFRANDDDLAFNSMIFNTISNGIGMEKVTEIISQTIDKLKSSTDKEQGYLNVDQKRIITGLEDFMKACSEIKGEFEPTLQNLYKYSILDKNQIEQVKNAFNYIINTLPNNAKTLLKIKSDGTEKGVLKLIASLIGSQIASEREFTLDLDKSNKDDNILTETFAYQVQQNKGGQKRTFKIDNGKGVSFNLDGTVFKQVFTPDYNPINDSTAYEMLSKSNLYSMAIDAYFGNQKIKHSDLKNIIYDDTQGIMRVNVPVDESGKPDLNLLNLYDDLRNDILLEEGTLEQLLNTDKYKKLKERINPDGSWNIKYAKPFIVFDGKVEDNLLEINDDNQFIREITLNDIDLTRYTSILNGNKEKGIFSDLSDDWYAGVIFISIDMNKNNSLQKINQTVGDKLEQEYLDSKKPGYNSINLNVL